MLSENNVENIHSDQEKIKVSENLSVEKKIETKEDIEKQIAELQARLEATKNQTNEVSQKENAKIDSTLIDIGGDNRKEEVFGVKKEISQIENQKQEIITEGAKEIEEVKNENILVEKLRIKSKELNDLRDKKIKDQGDGNTDNEIKQKEAEYTDIINEIRKEKSEQQNINPLNRVREDFQKKEQGNIQSATSLPELYKILKENGGMQGSTEHYSADQIWDRIRAYVNGEVDENVITRTDGLREKVKELKKQREVEKSIPKIEVNNSVDKINYFPGKKVSIKRSNGAIETDWNISGEPRVINGVKVFRVYKGEYQDPRLPLKEGTIYKDQDEKDLNELNK